MDEIVKDFMDFVRIDASSKNERKIADKIIEKFILLNLDYYEDDTGKKIGGNSGNLIGKLKGDANIEPVMFSAHMDRVSNGTGIIPYIDGDIIKSKSNTILAADDIAGIVSILHGIKKIKDEKIKHGDIEIVFTVCEEKGVTGSKFLDYSRLNSKKCYVFDSSGRLGRVVNQGITKNTIKVEVFGKPSHAGNEPEKGINAIIGASKFLSSIKEGRLNKLTTSNFGIINGGKATNVVCDYVEIIGEVRSQDDEEIKKYKDNLLNIAKEIEKNSQFKFNLNFEENYKGFNVNREKEICRLLEESFSNINIKSVFEKGGGGMDANRFNANNIDSVGVATGYNNNHTNEEEIIIEDLERSSELVKNIIHNISKKQEE